MATIPQGKGEASAQNSNEIHSPLRQPGRPLPEPSLGMSYENNQLGQESAAPELKPRWSADDAKRDEYWRGYYDRKRRETERERETAYYPDYPRPMQRYLEFPDEGGSTMYRSTSRASRVPMSYQPRQRVTRPMSDMPKKIPVELEDDDDYDEVYIVRGERKHPPTGGPPRRRSLDSSEYRLPYTKWMSKTLKGHFVAAIGEFVGTSMFLFFAFAGTQVANVGSQTAQNTTTNAQTGFSPEVLLYIALSFGFSLMVNVWVFFRISGGLFNPAVTLAMAMTRAISAFRAVLLVSMQIAGSIFASEVVKVLFPTDFKVRTTLSSGTSLVRGVFIEGILTFELVFTIFLLAKEKHRATFIAPVGIGLALFIAELVGVYYTGGSLNPARSFGPCVVTGSFDKEHWIYWVGPGAGAIAAVIFYKFIKILEYEIANVSFITEFGFIN
ncbi:uncharacterized protein PV09_00551 [Verruconis gallopava]|uniref:Aquaporin n=1 Tax=Verruconis gallopava TaxID=253628 RepID=A0A0D2APH7_9PEZI|nr:uncharacterized protein PV09_00551 [Verruconis gallopava]KIW08588.1 hypothetical protein PV09_00551 [Verruconis gallopava]